MTKFCVHCGAEHNKRGLFCKPECWTAYRREKKEERANTKCRLCQHPSTPEERERYKRWRRWERTQERLLDSEQQVTEESSPCQM